MIFEKLNEGAGVNKRMYAISDAIAREVATQAVPEILVNERLLMSWNEDYDDTYDGSCEGIDYDIFYANSAAGTLNGEADVQNNSISINFKVIERALRNEDIIDSSLPWISDEEFDPESYAEVAEYYTDYAIMTVYGVIRPIILHELTHTLNKESDAFDRMWIKNVNRFTEDDVRRILYLFSRSEMNSRVASSSAIFAHYLSYFTSGKEQKNALGNETGFFKQLLKQCIWDNQELCCGEMESYINLMKQDECSEEYLKSMLWRKRPSMVYSLVFQLARNEAGLYKRSNDLGVLRAFAKNPEGFKEKVINFYEGVYQQYRNRIIRACWDTFKKFSLENGTFDGEEAL